MNTCKINTFYTPQGALNVEVLGHGSLSFTLNEMQIYVDPYSDVCDYSKLPKADMILLTHAHTDHYDCKAIANIAKEDTIFVVSRAVETVINNNLHQMELDLANNPLLVDESTNIESMVSVIPQIANAPIHTLCNGESKSINQIEITAVAAYNVERKRDNGNPFHLKGEGNGYILNIGGFKVYIAGDTEFIPEIESVKFPDIAFIPKNLPYTMSDAQFIKMTNAIMPRIIYPVHYFEMNQVALRKEIDSNTLMIVEGIIY